MYFSLSKKLWGHVQLEQTGIILTGRSSCTLWRGFSDLPASSYDRMSTVNKPNCEDPLQADTDGLMKMGIVGIRGQCSATSRLRGSPFLWKIERSLDLWPLWFSSQATIFPFPVMSCIQRNWWECILFWPAESCFYQTHTGKSRRMQDCYHGFLLVVLCIWFWWESVMLKRRG